MWLVKLHVGIVNVWACVGLYKLVQVWQKCYCASVGGAQEAYGSQFMRVCICLHVYNSCFSETATS